MDAINFLLVRHGDSHRGAIDALLERLTDFWAAGRSRARFLVQTPLLRASGPWVDAWVTAGLSGVRSP
jgi:hypothetical protein